MTHTLIVPGVGGSEYNHWQTCLQHRLMRCSRVQQKTGIIRYWMYGSQNLLKPASHSR